MRRSPVFTLVAFFTVAIGWLAATLVSGNSPQLGLDLQGGASVVLEPREDVPQGVLDQAIEIIRNRVDALGVAEPEITRQGKSIIVSLPGVENRERALQVVGQTAQLLFRPVIQLHHHLFDDTDHGRAGGIHDHHVDHRSHRPQQHHRP
jgi:preprotein translocase subunit SecD